MKLGLNSVLWVVAFLLLGFSVVYFFSTITSLGLVETAPKTTVPPSVTRSAQDTKYLGTVVKVDPLSQGFGTHRLLNDSGDVLAYLESRSIDLSIIEGRKVNIEGRRERLVGAGVPLIEVEVVNLNNND